LVDAATIMSPPETDPQHHLAVYLATAKELAAGCVHRDDDPPGWREMKVAGHAGRTSAASLAI